ncbi:DUF885 domain-containing protein [Croceicoccus marinus]|uniref:DUF885 family protein n=1 Tax=Croceicoccus marinus TaxID=450378 RepID=A0A7G6VXA8_9SPHN|nr:DUF885 family protein [Croceicoccus marinus]QNE06373.1 DUF885 family protein [Croceicoccus marinus]
MHRLILPLAVLLAPALPALPALAQTPAGNGAESPAGNGAQARGESASGADARLRALYEEDHAWVTADRRRILTADGRSEAGPRLPSATAQAEARRADHARDMLARLDAIPAARLSDAEAVNAAVFRAILEGRIGEADYRGFEMPFNSDSNFWTYLDARAPYSDVADYENYIARMRDVPRYFAEHVANARAGMQRGFSVPRVSLEGRDASIEPYTRAEDNPFLNAFDRMPASIPADKQARLRAEAEAAVADSIVPAYRDLLAFMRTEYLPGTRTSLAASDLPDGKAFYAQQIRQYTTLDLTAQEIHQIGLSEVARIEGEMRAIMQEVGFTGSIAEFNEALRSDPQFIARTPDELMGVSAYVAKRVDGRIGDYFGFLPRHRFAIRPVAPALAPYYTAGRGGLDACQMNTHDLPSRPLYNIPALTLHECSPGHSFQAGVALEQAAMPAFRRETYFSGFGEGWGLYTEYLGEEMGIYRTPYERFGRLSYEMWRAARLVIDTGIHAYGWDRERAIDYLASRTALSRHEVGTEVDRYISWPGQALAYKLGELTMRRVRARAEEALGPRFDIRKFHDVVLSLGSVPLPVLEQRIEAFIADGGRGLPGVVYD